MHASSAMVTYLFYFRRQKFKLLIYHDFLSQTPWEKYTFAELATFYDLAQVILFLNSFEKFLLTQEIDSFINIFYSQRVRNKKE